MLSLEVKVKNLDILNGMGSHLSLQKGRGLEMTRPQAVQDLRGSFAQSRSHSSRDANTDVCLNLQSISLTTGLSCPEITVNTDS